jgi:hypothetical protein
MLERYSVWAWLQALVSNRWFFGAVGFLLGLLFWPLIMVTVASHDGWEQLGILILTFYVAVGLAPVLVVLIFVVVVVSWFTGRKSPPNHLTLPDERAH